MKKVIHFPAFFICICLRNGQTFTYILPGKFRDPCVLDSSSGNNPSNYLSSHLTDNKNL